MESATLRGFLNDDLAVNSKFSAYAHPEALVDTDWLQEHLHDPAIRIVESNEDVLLYDTGHIPGAVHIDWRGDLQDNTVRDYITPEKFADVCSKNGITPATTVIFYGDKSNWWSCYALWVFRLFGHEPVKVLDGGRDKWNAEGRPLTRVKPAPARTAYPVPPQRRDAEIRAFFEDALAFSQTHRPLIDVRSPKEYTGEVTHMPEYPQEGVLRGGHVPGARSVPWKLAANDDATFKSAQELRRIYTQNLGLKPGDDTVVYCRIGERSSHTWFVLSYLLGYKNVRNYDGSWTEWAIGFGPRSQKASSRADLGAAPGTTPMTELSYPPALSQVIELFDSFGEDEKRENLIAFADQASHCAPRAGERFDLDDVRRDEECTDTVGVFLRVDPDTRAARLRITLGPQVQTLTKAMTAILCQGLSGATPEQILAVPGDFVPRIVGGQLVRIRSQTVYYILTRIKSACRVWVDRERAARAIGDAIPHENLE